MHFYLLIVFIDNIEAEADLARRIHRAVKAASDDHMHRCSTGMGALSIVFIPDSDAKFAALRRELEDQAHPLRKPYLLSQLDITATGTFDGIAWARTQWNRMIPPGSRP
jgi:hypothetical protein